jgi:hypothetical protein
VAPVRPSVLRGPRLDPELLLEDFRLRLQNLDQTVRDLAGGDGAPPGFDPDRFLAPGVPRVRPLLVLLSARAPISSRNRVPLSASSKRPGLELVAPVNAPFS